MERGLVAEIDLQAVSHNFRVIRQITGDRPVIAVVKADAYGHGAVRVSERLVSDGAECLAVAFMDEARELREAGITAPILVLFDPEVHEAFEYNVTPAVGTLKAAFDLSREAEKRGRNINIHIKVDTGMGRLGFRGQVQHDILAIAGLKGITIEGVMSHFSDADVSDRSFAFSQIAAFNTLRMDLAAAGLRIPLYHLANSAAVAALPEAHCDAVRPGIMLYGCPDSTLPKLVPAMSATARIVALRKLPPGTPISYGRTFVTERDSLIGVISAGYADGFSRLFSNNASVLVRGQRAPVVGRVCMDVTMIDVTDIAGVSEKDDVVIMGRQGYESISAAELAQWSGTIPYEVMLSLGSRARRIYI
ncbi:MAG TPA: alanine racemase [Dissulfurispiraceae bacterium]|nr:alanine racemase [Dissulfurispiraceae bacterium]